MKTRRKETIAMIVNSGVARVKARGSIRAGRIAREHAVKHLTGAITNMRHFRLVVGQEESASQQP